MVLFQHGSRYSRIDFSWGIFDADSRIAESSVFTDNLIASPDSSRSCFKFGRYVSLCPNASTCLSSSNVIRKMFASDLFSNSSRVSSFTGVTVFRGRGTAFESSDCSRERLATLSAGVILIEVFGVPFSAPAPSCLKGFGACDCGERLVISCSDLSTVGFVGVIDGGAGGDIDEDVGVLALASGGASGFEAAALP